MSQKIKETLKNSAYFRIFTFFAIVSFAIRTAFLIRQKAEMAFSITLLVKIYLVGFFLDFITFTYFSFIPLLYYILVPNKFFVKKIHHYFLLFLYLIFIYSILFDVASEWFFWDEFLARFNFIAVDYLIYTTEVIDNILESYPVFPILLLILSISLAVFSFTYKKIISAINKETNFTNRLKSCSLFLLLPIIFFFTIDSDKITTISNNNYAKEIASNGIYQLFSAYRNNQIDFHKFYKDNDSQNSSIEESLNKIKNEIIKQNPETKFLSKDPKNFTRAVAIKNNKEKKYNVIFVTVESLSAEYLGYFGNKDNITPNLDKLAKESLFFTNLKATGNRTVRGLEALTIAIPPTPGNSILRRQNNENLFNIGTPFVNRNYDLKFLYGGYGYFDNMNYFFENNGFKIVDRNSFDKKKIIFANAWGVSDEDLFNKTIEEADKSYKDNKPFFSFIMTTSNHRPFTYPDGRIDIKSKTNRDGAVKYTDYSIGKLIEDSKNKPWFKNTIFVIVADHCAGSAGNTDLPVWRYQIPAIFYAPEIIRPRIFDKNISQIDIAPTLLGVMNFSYNSKFIGNDVITNEKYIKERAFMGTYEIISYYTNNKLFTLMPKKQIKIFDVKLKNFGWNGSEEIVTKNYNQDNLDETINYYRATDYLFNHDLIKNDEYTTK